jgi:hypothetical protein
MNTVRELRQDAAMLLRQILSGGEAVWPQQGGLTADIFFREASAQGMAPLLFRRLAAQKGSCWPAELLAKLREASLRLAAAELLLEADLRSLLKSLTDIGVQPLLLKGTALAYSLYPEPWLRPRCDTDLLISASDREKTDRLLLRLGCTALHEAAADGINAQVSWSRRRQGVDCRYDIHWRISNASGSFSRAFADENLFARAAAVPSLGEHARTLSKTDALLCACFHRAGHFAHSGDRLIWLHDLHLLCQSLTGEEAAAFCSQAEELEISALCADGLKTAAFWFGTTFPAGLAQLFKEQRGERFALLLQHGRQAGIKSHALLELKGLPTWRDRLRFVWQNLFPPAKYMLWRYGAKRRAALPLLYAKRLAEAASILLQRQGR